MTAAEHHARIGVTVALGLLVAAVGAVAVLLFHHAFVHAPVNNDAGYFLSTVERHSEGWVPSRDLPSGYTPLGLHILLGARLVVGPSMTYPGYLAVIFLFHLLGALLVWRLARRLGAGRLESVGAAVLMLILVYTNEGTFIALEPFVALFVLLAVHACLTAREQPVFLLLAGICVGLAFLCKQYGVAALAPVGLYALATGSGLWNRLARGTLVAIGFVLPITVLLISYQVLLDVAPADLLRGWGGRQYAWWGAARAGPILEQLLWPGLLVLVWLPFAAWAYRRSAGFWLVLGTALILLTPLMVRSYEHYLLLAIPFFATLSALVVTWGRAGRWRMAAVGLTAIATLVLTARSAHRDFRVHRVAWNRATQQQIADALGEHIPPGGVGQVIGNPEQWLNYLADLRPPRPALTGYAFPTNFPDEAAGEVFRAAPVVVGRTSALDSDPRWRALLEANGFEQVDVIDEDLEVHRRRR